MILPTALTLHAQPVVSLRDGDEVAGRVLRDVWGSLPSASCTSRHTDLVLVVLPGAGHMLPFEAPDAVVEAITAVA